MRYPWELLKRSVFHLQYFRWLASQRNAIPLSFTTTARYTIKVTSFMTLKVERKTPAGINWMSAPNKAVARQRRSGLSARFDPTLGAGKLLVPFGKIGS